MSLIDKTYFKGNISIPQLFTEDSVEGLVNFFIGKYETDFLSDVLGYSFQNLVVATPTVAPYVDIVQGKEYTDRKGIVRFWPGLANSANKHSPIAQYIYWQYIRDQYEVKTGISTVRPKAENAMRVAPEYTLNDCWNDMCRMIENLHEFMHANAAAYPVYIAKQTKCFHRSNRFF